MNNYMEMYKGVEIFQYQKFASNKLVLSNSNRYNACSVKLGRDKHEQRNPPKRVM